MPLAGLVRLAEIRWRIEHDYRQLNMAWAWATSQADRGPAAVITTSPISPSPTPFSPNSASFYLLNCRTGA